MRLSFLDSPITRAELRYQRWVRQPLHGLDKLAHLIGICLALFLGAVIGSMFGFDFRPIGETLRPLFYILAVIAVVVHFNTMIQAVTVAADAVAREKGRGTWDMLLLTNIDARQIVYGKWWATVQQMWPLFLAGGILRLGLVFWLWLAIEIAQRFELFPNPIFLSNPLQILWSGVSVMFLSLFNLSVTAAFGVLASLLNPHKRQALALAITLRTVVLIVSAAILWIMGEIIVPPYSGLLLLINTWPWGEGIPALLRLSSVTMLDNGSILAMGLARGVLGRQLGNIELVVHVLIPLMVYLLLTWLALRIAQAIAVRQGALPPARVRAFNSTAG